MNISVNLSLKALANMLFLAFTSERKEYIGHGAYRVKPSVDDEYFYWNLMPIADDGNGVKDSVFCVRVFKGHISHYADRHELFFSNAYRMFLFSAQANIDKFSSQNPPIKSYYQPDLLIDEQAQVFNLAHPLSQPPKDKDKDGYSRSVVIDVDGLRKNFEIGYYSHRAKEWISQQGNSKIDPEQGSWHDILPLRD